MGNHRGHLFPKTMKRLYLLIMLSVFSLGIVHAELNYSLSNDGTLTISGTYMPDYYDDGAPWDSQRDNIKNVIIENGVTRIGGEAFMECSGLTSIVIPNSVTSIGGAHSLIALVSPQSLFRTL